MNEIVEEQIRFQSGGLNLSGVLAYPEQKPPAFSALLCAPHPNFAGNMENNIIVALSHGLAVDGITLRFDYRGIGESEIKLAEDISVYDYWSQIEDDQRYHDPIEDALGAQNQMINAAPDVPHFVIGYSFGAIIGCEISHRLMHVKSAVAIAPPLKRYNFAVLSEFTKPCLLLSGSEDFVLDSNVFSGNWSESVSTLLLPDKDHFFRGDEALLCAHVRDFVHRVLDLNRERT